MALAGIKILALQALRAPGGMSVEQAWARWPSTGTHPLRALVRAGLAATDGELFTITEAGRAACPFNNPILAARSAWKAKETPMNMQCHSYKDVVAAIAAAGPSGLTRSQLADKFAADSRADQTRIDAHVFYALTKVTQPAIAKIKPGHYVAAEFAPETETAETRVLAAIRRITTPEAAGAEVPEEEVAKIARQFDEMIDFDLEDAQGVDVTAADGADKARHGVTPTAPAPFSEDIELDDPEQVEFAIFSSGGLDMYTDRGNVTLSRDVLRKLRDFLGLFAEGA